jgi:hypothetical protein
MAEEQKMSGPSIPQYGNFGGNGDNDAWEQADRYATFSANGYDAHSLAGGSPGSGSLPDYHDYPLNTIVHLPRVSSNVGLVKSILADIDRQPVSDLDTAYVNHDIFFVDDNAISNIVNNNAMGVSVWTALTSGGAGMDPYGYLYGATSVPFIIGAGSVFNVLNDVKNHTPPSEITEVDTVYVVATAPLPNNIIQLTTHVIGDAIGGFYQAVTNITGQAWSDFTSALGSGWSNITGAVGSAWQWFQETIFQQHRAASDSLDIPLLDGFADHDLIQTDSPSTHLGDNPWGQISKLNIEYISVHAGDAIKTGDLTLYDDDRDGLLTIDDNISTSLGIFTTNEHGVVTLRPLDGADAVDVLTGLNNGVAASIGATRDFLNAVNTGGSETGPNDIPVSTALADGLKVAVAGSLIIQSDNWAI